MDDRLRDHLVGHENTFFGRKLADQVAVSGVYAAYDRRFVVREPGEARQIPAIKPEGEQHDGEAEDGKGEAEVEQTDEPAGEQRRTLAGFPVLPPGIRLPAVRLRRLLGGDPVFRRDSDVAHMALRPAPTGPADGAGYERFPSAPPAHRRSIAIAGSSEQVPSVTSIWSNQGGVATHRGKFPAPSAR